jgi:hypothetical protein
MGFAGRKRESPSGAGRIRKKTQKKTRARALASVSVCPGRCLRVHTVVVLDSEDCEGCEIWGTGKFKEVPASQGDARKVLFPVAEGVTGAQP